MAENTPDQEDKRPGLLRNIAKAASESIGQAAGAARDKVTETAATVMGTTVEKTVTEYSELYTQVLLGMHKHLEALQTSVVTMAKTTDAAKAETAALRTEAASLKTDVAALREQVQALQRWRMLAMVAALIAVIALAGVVWTAAS